MSEYSRIAKGNIATTGGTIYQYLPFQPTSLKWWNYTAMATPTSGGVAHGYWDVSMGQGYAVYDLFNATPVLTTDATSSGGVSTFSAGLSASYGPQLTIIGATAANPIVFNVTAHGYAVGDIVEFQGLYQSSTTGMPQISGMPFVVSAVADSSHFSVVWPGTGSNYTALSGSPAGAYVRKVLYPFLYSPGKAYIEAITTGTTTTVVTTAPNNFVVGQQIAFHVPPSWGTVQINENNGTIPGSPMYGYVLSITNSTTFVCNINSTGFTAFNTNQTVAATQAGLSFPVVVAVGDVNSGGVQISSGSALYPPPSVNGVNTINGPAIQGAYVNNTRNGFSLGSVICPTASQTVYWEAVLNDFVYN